MPVRALRGEWLLSLQRRVVLMHTVGQRNKVKLALMLFLRASYCFYLWRMRNSQCNELTVNSSHARFQVLPADCQGKDPAGYFRFLARREQYVAESEECLPTPRYVIGQVAGQKYVRLDALRTVARLGRCKQMFSAWRARAARGKVMRKFVQLYLRKKVLFRHFEYMRKLAGMRRVVEASLGAAARYHKIRLAKNGLLGLKTHTRRRKETLNSISMRRSTRTGKRLA